MFRHAVAPLLEAVNNLYGARAPQICAEMKDYFRDVSDHLQRLNQTIESIRDTIATAIAVNLSMISLQENETMKRLAAYGALVAVPTMIAGIYGMNFEHMPELGWKLRLRDSSIALMVAIDALPVLPPAQGEVALTWRERTYFLGTHDEELERLGLQHRVWRPTVLECWRRAGIGPGSKVLDVGAGPGFASADLAEIVGPAGRVVAVERSARFVEAGRAMLASHGLANVEYHELDLMTDPLPAGGMDASWCRWVACFVASPALLLDKIAAVIRPGGVAIFHEYIQYDSLRITTAGPAHARVRAAGRAGLARGRRRAEHRARRRALLQERGFSIRDAIPRVFCARPGRRDVAVAGDVHRHPPAPPARDWAASRQSWAEAVRAEFAAAEQQAATLLITPMVLEIVAEKRH